MLQVSLPWPPRELQPNFRGHWSKKSRAAKKYHEWSFLCACQALGSSKAILQNPSPVKLTFFRPNRRANDTDNLGASIKFGLDGIAQALKIDDFLFNPVEIERSDQIIPNGKVLVQIPCLFRA